MKTTHIKAVMFIVVICIFLSTAIVVLYRLAIDTTNPVSDTLVKGVLLANATALLKLFYDLFKPKKGHGEDELASSLILNGCEVQVLQGDIVSFHAEDHTVAYSTNVFFDTTSENGLVNYERSAWGQYLKKKAELKTLNELLDVTLETKGLPSDEYQETIQKQGRLKAFCPGSCVFLGSGKDRLLLVATARVSSQFKAIFTEDSLDTCFRKFWQYVADQPGIHHLYVPVIGAGFGGIAPAVALARNLLCLREVMMGRNARLCEKITFVIYKTQAKEGQWAKRVLNAVFQDQ